MPNGWSKPRTVADRRTALAPLLAYEALAAAGEEYDWLLVGDDDTIFFLEGVHRLLKTFDPSLPYMITDTFWQVKECEPNCLQRLCRPCDEPPSPGRPASGCPCTPRSVCAGLLGANATEDAITKCVQDTRQPQYEGGSGVLISRGYFDAATKLWNGTLQPWIDCVNTINDTGGGDATVSMCMWRNGATPITLPKPYDPKTPARYRRFGGNWRAWAVLDPSLLIKAPWEIVDERITAEDVNRVLHGVSFHTGAKMDTRTQRDQALMETPAQLQLLKAYYLFERAVRIHMLAAPYTQALQLLASHGAMDPGWKIASGLLVEQFVPYVRRTAINASDLRATAVAMG